MKLRKFINIMEETAPEKYKESYDNVGLMVGDEESEITKVLVALDCTKAVIEEAKEKGAELILTHHPLLFRKPSNITEGTLQGEKIRALIKNDIALYSSHTNWDSVKGGLNDEFVAFLGFNSGEIIEKNSFDAEAGIGRIVSLEKGERLSTLATTVKKKLKVPTVRVAGDLNKIIKKIAFINGSGEDFFQKALEKNVDLVITGDTTYHFASDYSEMGMAILDVGHFNSEWPVLVSLIKALEKKVTNYEIKIIISEAVKDPYVYI